MDIMGTSGMKRSLIKESGNSSSKKRKIVNAQDKHFEKTVSEWLDESDFSDCDSCPEDFVPSCSDDDTSSEQGLSHGENNLEHSADESSNSNEESADLPRSVK